MDPGLNRAYDAGKISARGHIRVLRVARTVADLQGATNVTLEHVEIALRLHPHGQSK